MNRVEVLEKCLSIKSLKMIGLYFEDFKSSGSKDL